MIVKNLIKQLMEMPMDAEVCVGIKNNDGNYIYGKEKLIVADYGDGEVGIIARKEEGDTNEN